jgi:hypothetical protein
MSGNLGGNRGTMPTDSWVGGEVLGTASHFAVDGAGIVPRCPIGKREDWEILLPKAVDRICSCFPRDRLPMYEATFKEVGFRLPFSSFQASVFEWLELCPSQLKPDSFAYLMAFELVCRFLQLPASKDLFFAIFTVQRGSNKDGGCNWVSFRQRTTLFENFSSGAKRFHERFFLVKPRTEVALRSVLKVVARPHGDGGVTSVRVPRFHFSWCLDHFKHEPAMYRYNYDKLTEWDKDSFASIVEFVNSFSRSELVDEGGNPVMDSRGNPVTKPRLIDTRSLVFSKNPHVLLGTLELLLFLYFYSLDFCLMIYLCFHVQEKCLTSVP